MVVGVLQQDGGGDGGNAGDRVERKIATWRRFCWSWAGHGQTSVAPWPGGRLPWSQPAVTGRFQSAKEASTGRQQGVDPLDLQKQPLGAVKKEATAWRPSGTASRSVASRSASPRNSWPNALDVDPSTVRRWESGVSEKGPLPWLRPKLAQCLQVSIEQLDDLLTEDTHHSAADDERLAYALQHPGSVDLVAVARLREQVRALDERYDSAPSTSLLAETGQCLGKVAFLRAHAPTNRVRRELWAAETESATLMGQLVWDASQRRDHATANAYFDQAVTAARQLNDPVAESLALLRKSFVALYGEKDPVAGLTLTRQTADTASGVSHVLAGLAVLHTAEAHAMLGQQRECEQALADADGYFDQVDDADVALDLFSPTQPGRLAGSCYLFLDRAKHAQPILEATADELRDRSKSQAIVLGNLSLALLRQGQPDQAVAVLHQAIDVVEQTWGGGGLNIMFDACRELRPWRQAPAMQDVYDRVMALMAST
ncbi:transcriptional regulator [Actinophytocola sp.]|uniref:transcriptional regulator n=1 Tax=Actinophytocola sp. TaxID=1872138 RepID=UPI003D6A4FFD